MPETVTISVTRHIDPDQADRMIAWINAGASLVQRFDGFLGTGWVRPASDSDQWHMLYRFESPQAMERWEASSQRRWWLDAAGGIVGQSVKEERTGIEGWFDEPATTDIADLRPAPSAPPRWKQGTVIWLAFFPLSLLSTWLLSLVLPGDFSLPLRVFLTTVLLTPVMVYVALPRITAWMSWWLAGDPPPWKADRESGSQGSTS